MARRIDAGTGVAAAGALLLLISLFLDWYEPGFSAWTVFEFVDLVLALLAIAGLTAVAASAGVDLPFTRAVFPVVGALAFVIVVSQLLNHPPAVQGEDADLELGAWLALAGAAALLVGSVLALTNVSLALSVEPKEPPAGTPPPPGQPPAPERREEGSLLADRPTGEPAPERPEAPGPEDETARLEDEKGTA
jgi:hypothetical protein